MISQIILDSTPLTIENFAHTTKSDQTSPDILRHVSFDFDVTSEDYHDITKLLYKNEFTVTIPGKNITFDATISNYSTSITNLYEENQTGNFHLELTENSTFI